MSEHFFIVRHKPSGAIMGRSAKTFQSDLTWEDAGKLPPRVWRKLSHARSWLTTYLKGVREIKDVFILGRWGGTKWSFVPENKRNPKEFEIVECVLKEVAVHD